MATRKILFRGQTRRKYKEEKPVKDAQKILDAISELFGEEVTSK